jgi:ABC-type multidrug transport system ATPase subunit
MSIEIIGTPKSGKTTFIKKYMEAMTNYKPKLLVLGNKRDLHESKEYRSYYSELIDLVKHLKGTYMAVSLKSNYNWLSIKKETNTLGLFINKQ